MLLEQLWSAHTVLLQAALQDRQAVEEQWAAAKAAAAAAAVEQQQLQQHHEDECVALRAISERHAAKADAAKQDFDKLKQQHDNVSPSGTCMPENPRERLVCQHHIAIG